MNKTAIERRENVKKRECDDFSGFEDEEDLLNNKSNLWIIRIIIETTVYIIHLLEEVRILNILIELTKVVDRFDLEIIGEILYHM